jgi:multidrug efflux system membrane fusion protein
MADTTPRTAVDLSAPPVHSRRNVGLLLTGSVIAGVLLLWYLAQRGKPPTSSRSGGRPGASVGIARAERIDVPVYLTAMGTVQPVVVATVRPQLAGTLFSIEFKEGQEVNKGQLLAQIDPRPYELALSQAKGVLGRDQALLAAARADVDRYTSLQKEGLIARQQVDTQKATVHQLEGTVLADEAGVGAARLNLAYTSITAPVSGKVGFRQADIGNYLTPSYANGIVVIAQTTPIDVVFALPQDQLPTVLERLHEQAELPVTARDKTDTVILGTGSFLTFDNQIDVTTGTVRAKARFANADGRLFPNQFVNVALLVNTLSQAVTVPVSTVRHGAQGDFVFTVLPNKTARLRVVHTGPSNEGRTVILSGIDADDTVITEGADRLEDGSRLNLPASASAGGDKAEPERGANRDPMKRANREPNASTDSGSTSGVRP